MDLNIRKITNHPPSPENTTLKYIYFIEKYEIYRNPIDIVSMVVQIIPTGKNLPNRLQISEYLCPCMIMKPGDKSVQIYIT